MKFYYRLVYILLWHFLKIRNPIHVRGRENIPQGAAVICANHRSMLDPLIIANAFGWKHCLHFMAKAELVRVPFLGSILKKVGAIFVRRGERDMSAIKSALDCLKSGRKVAIFPEGTRVKDGQSAHARTGAAMLALRTDVPVVPVYLDNPARRPFGKLNVVIGEPFRLARRRSSRSELYKFSAEEILKKISVLGKAV
jgi:1-acyl-sn-glycerol-3-phosphate acyltransferase